MQKPIELLAYNAIKPLLRVKSFEGTKAHAVYTQIRAAMIAVLLRMLKSQSKFAYVQSRFVSAHELIQQNSPMEMDRITI